MKKVKYVPRSGVSAGKRNFNRVKDYLEKNPTATGREIAQALKLSLPTVYGHLKKLQ